MPTLESERFKALRICKNHGITVKRSMLSKDGSRLRFRAISNDGIENFCGPEVDFIRWCKTLDGMVLHPQPKRVKVEDPE